MSIYHEVFEHGIGMRDGQPVTYRVPGCASTFRAMTAVDDAWRGGGSARFSALLDGREIWRSHEANPGERQMAVLSLLKVDGG